MAVETFGTMERFAARKEALKNMGRLTPTWDDETLQEVAKAFKPTIEAMKETLGRFSPILGGGDRYNDDYFREVQAMKVRGGDAALGFYTTARSVLEGEYLIKFGDVDVYYRDDKAKLAQKRQEDKAEKKRIGMALALIRAGVVNDPDELAAARIALKQFDPYEQKAA